MFGISFFLQCSLLSTDGLIPVVLFQLSTDAHSSINVIDLGCSLAIDFVCSLKTFSRPFFHGWEDSSTRVLYLSFKCLLLCVGLLFGNFSSSLESLVPLPLRLFCRQVSASGLHSPLHHCTHLDLIHLRNFFFFFVVL